MTQKARSAAQGLASLGRYGDDTLVHMSSREVAGLQNLARANGTSLTVNPRTGMPEAFNLDKLLPMIGGAIVGVVAPGALPWVAGATGLGEYASGKSVQQSLLDAGKVLGGGALTSGLGAAGAATAPTTTTAAVPTATTTTSAVTPELTAAAAPETEYVGADLVAKTPTPTVEAPVNNLASTGVKSADIGNTGQFNNANYEGWEEGQVSPGQVPYRLETTTTPFDTTKALTNDQLAAGKASYLDKGTLNDRASDFGRGVKGLLDPRNTSITFDNTLGAMSTPAKIGLYSGLADAFMSQEKKKEPEKEKPIYYIRDPESGKPLFSQGEVNPNVAKFGYIPQGESYFIGRQFNPGVYSRSYDHYEPVEGMAAGGLAGLGHTYKAGGKLLRGPGDGMSDSIPAVIGGHKPQRAALADGEFVVPADVVSHLGNGSTEAGSRKLYAMMDKIRHARTGRKKQAPRINAERFMPR